MIKYFFSRVCWDVRRFFINLKNWFKAHKIVRGLITDHTEMQYEIYWIRRMIECEERCKKYLDNQDKIDALIRLLRMASLIYKEYDFPYNFKKYVNPKNLSHYEVRDGFEWIDKARNIYYRLKVHIFMHY